MANEQKKGIYELNLDSDVFLGLKTDFNKILRRTLSNMESKHSDEAEVTVKLKISTKNEKEEDTKQEYAQLNPAKPQLEEGKEDAEDVIEGVYREINAEDDKDDGNAEDIQYDEPEN